MTRHPREAAGRMSAGRRFKPAVAFVERDALRYPLGVEIKRRLEEDGVPTEVMTSHRAVRERLGEDPARQYRESKRVLVVAVSKISRLAKCRPSADYQIPLATSCPAMCEYCHLATTLGPRPYLRVYVNLDRILWRALHLIEDSSGVVSFEGAATSDPVPVERYTGSLRRCISLSSSSRTDSRRAPARSYAPYTPRGAYL